MVPKHVLSAINMAEEASFTDNQVDTRTAMLCQAIGAEVMAQRGFDGHQVILTIQLRARKHKEWVHYEDEPPTKVSEQNGFKVHAFGFISKYCLTPLFVTMVSNGIKAKSKGVNGEVCLTFLHEHVIPACEILMA
jgi:ubiquitin-protein ligase